MQLAKQNVSKRIKIANIQFGQTLSSKRRTPSPLLSFKNQILRAEVQPVHHKDSIITRNSFIPKSGIRMHIPEPCRKASNKPLRPASVCHSKFPLRRPISVKGSFLYSPAVRQKVYSFTNTEDLNLDPRRSVRQSSKIDRMRATTASCLTFNRKTMEIESPARYSQSSKARRTTANFKTYDDRWQQIEKIIF